MPKEKIKRMGVFADTHCGSQVGLTPRRFEWGMIEGDPERHNKYAKVREDCWKWFLANRPRDLDLAVWNGDLIDGQGTRTGGVEQLTTNRNKQVKMAAEIIRTVGAKHNIIIFGTGYHVGLEEDWEEIIADNVSVDKLGNHEWVDINGVIFDFKHKVASSSVPYGRHTAASRDRTWSDKWAAKGLTPKSEIVVRSHVHYYTVSGDSSGTSFTTPALQGMGTRFGARDCTGIVDFGFLLFNVDSKGAYSYEAVLADIDSQKTHAFKL